LLYHLGKGYHSLRDWILHLGIHLEMEGLDPPFVGKLGRLSEAEGT